MLAQENGVVQARDLDNTSLVVDSYGQGDLLGSQEAKEVAFKFQAMTDEPAVCGSLIEALSWLAD